MGPNGEIPLRRNEDGEIVYMSQEEAEARAKSKLVFDTPEGAAAAIGRLNTLLALIEHGMRNPLPAEARPSQTESQETTETEPRDPDTLLDAKEVGEILGIPRDSVYELGGLTRTQLGPRRVRWKLADVREFIERRRERF